MKATKEQLASIAARGEVLVSASAGAGKTTVMIERLANILCGDGGKELVDLDNVLCVTFTKKAAAHMKEKLRTELVKRLKDANEDLRKHLRVQLGKINSADISTIDSFCSRLVKTYFYELKIEANFQQIADDAEKEELMSRAMDTLFDEGYASASPDFLLVVERLKKGRSDKAVKSSISASYERIRICPDYKKMLEEACANTFTESGFLSVCACMKEAVNQRLNAIIQAIDDYIAGDGQQLDGEGYFNVLNDMRQNIEEYVQSDDLFSAPQKLTSLSRPKGEGEAVKAFDDFSKSVKKRFKELTAFDEEQERVHFFESGKLAVAYTKLVLAFDEEYAGVKRFEGKLDFGDLAQYALRLLRGEDCDIGIKESIKNKYQYVFVDEYQDVNPIQDEIISLAAGNDVFLVGDVKQAIYGFRGSRSEFFSNKCQRVGKNASYIVLPDNFRSSSAVIDFVNENFSKIMTPQFCSFDYANGHAMRGGSRYGEEHKGVAEFCLFYKDEEQKRVADKVYSVAGERAEKKRTSNGALAVLSLVRKALSSTYYDADSGKEVKVQTGDICILTRKNSTAAVQEIIKVLSKEYPVASSAEINICERPEILKMLDILSYLNNGEQDIPLASTMLSPLGGFCENDLVTIRAHGGRGVKNFRAAVEGYAVRRDDELAKRITIFFNRIENLKKLSACVGAAKLIDEIMKNGSFAAEFSSPAKLNYLRALQRYAYGADGELSLAAFLAKVKAAKGKICAPASVASDCITVMSMHASKGLEFPVVIIADIAASFRGDSGDNMKFDEHFGFAPKYYCEDRSCSETLLRRLISLKEARENISNELNLLYVAFTRAKYALYVVTAEAKSYNLLNALYATNYSSLVNFEGQQMQKLDLTSVQTVNEQLSPLPVLDCPDKELLSKIKQASGYKYGFEQAISLPVKSSATGLMAERDNIDDGVILFPVEHESEGGKVKDAAMVGIAYHRFLELCDFAQNGKEDIARQLEKFAVSGHISAEQLQLLDKDELFKILQMPAFKGVLGTTLYREREFLCKLSSAEYVGLKEGEILNDATIRDDGNGVIVQGAIDLLSVKRENGKAVSASIIDYKYTSKTDEAVIKKYSPQLALYKSVVCKIYGLEKSCVSTTIINLRACRQIDLNV